MLRSAFLPVLIVLIGATGLGCDEAGPTAPSRADVVNQTWRLLSIQRADGTTVDVSTPDRFTMQFGDNGRLSVRADCNSCSGAYTMNGTEFTVGAMACTRAYCGSESLDTEFLSAFGAPASIVSADGALFLTRSGTRLTFRP